MFYTEETEKYEVLFKHVVDVKKKYFETTLLDNLQLSPARFDYFNLGYAVTVRCATFNNVKSRFTPFKVGKYIAAVEFDKKDSGPREWRDFRYAAYTALGQDERNNAMARFESHYQPVDLKNQNPLQLQEREQSNARIDENEDTEDTRPVENTIERIQRWNHDVPAQGSQSSAGLYGNSQSNHETSKSKALLSQSMFCLLGFVSDFFIE